MFFAYEGISYSGMPTTSFGLRICGDMKTDDEYFTTNSKARLHRSSCVYKRYDPDRFSYKLSKSQL